MFGRLLRFVGREGRVAGRLDFHDVQRLAGEDHVAVPHAVDELRLMVVEAADDLARGDRRLGAVFLLQAEGVQNRCPAWRISACDSE